MQIKCPNCGANYEVTESELGTNADCMECGKAFVVGQEKIQSSSSSKKMPILSNTQAHYTQRRPLQMTSNVDTSNKGGVFSFNGRARRSEWWTISIVPWIVLIGIFLAIGVANEWDFSRMSGGAAFFLLVIILVAIVLPIPVGVRRLHDRNMPGWWLLVFWLGNMVPFIGWIVGITQFVIMGCLDGTPGDNDYGPDPKGRQSLQPVVRTPVYSQPSARTTESPEDRLLKLMKLKEAGVLTDEEYEIRRMRLVASLDE